MAGIENVKASLDAVKELAESIGKVLEDGQVGISDIKEVPELFSEVRALVAAVKDVKEELNDLDAGEIKEIIAELIEVVVMVAQKFGLKI